MTQIIRWKTGFEIELMAPIQLSRQDLAETLATQNGGTVERFFHSQSEPSKVPNHPTFDNLTHGFRLLDRSGEWVASFVDDLTLQRDCNRQIASRAGWYRVIADDGRILRLVMLHCDADATAAEILNPLANLFGTELQSHDAGMFRVVDDRGISVAICAPLPGERERPCEIVTAPIESNHKGELSSLLLQAQALGFSIPQEGATHIHFDANPLCSAQAMANLVRLFGHFGPELKQLVGVNPNCVRLGPWPKELAELTESASFRAMSWPDARQALANLRLTKYCDFNLLNIAMNSREKHTFEVRILPSTLDADMVLNATALFEGLLRLCCEPQHLLDDFPESLSAAVKAAPISTAVQDYWQG
jgi:hypothetical protein